MKKLITCVLLSLICMKPVLAQEEEAGPIIHFEGVVEDLAIDYPPVPAGAEEAAVDGAPLQGHILWAQDFLRLGSSSVQLKLEDRGSAANANGWIEIRDGNGDLVERIEAARLAQEGEVWTNLAFGPFVELLVVGEQGSDLAFAIAAISFERSGARVESIIGRDGRQHIIQYTGAFSEMLPSVEGAVAKLTFIKTRNGFPARFVCSGFLIANDLLLTNEHCVATQDVCDTTKALFGFSVNQFGIARPKEQLRCLQVEKVSAPLDYALLRLEGSPGERWGTLRLAERAARAGEKVFVVQHPAGEAKQISDENCVVVGPSVTGGAPNADLSHSCDTLGGSSGSPVLDASGEVLALHHLGKNASGPFAELNRAVLSMKLVGELSP